MTFGRDSSNTLKFPDDYKGISRKHATLQLQNGVITLTDISSTEIVLKSTRAPIPKNTPVRLEAGDVFYMGDSTNRFEIVYR